MISSVYQASNFLFGKSFAGLFTVMSIGITGVGWEQACMDAIVFEQIIHLTGYLFL